ncbi:MAG: dockerin type I domain-containing protein [bacterium]
MDMDGTIGARDFAIIRRIILGSYVNENEVNADINSDGQVDSTDYLLLSRYLLGIISYF